MRSVLGQQRRESRQVTERVLGDEPGRGVEHLGHSQMGLAVLSDVRTVHHNRDSHLGQMLLGPDAGELQEPGRVDGTRRDDNLGGHDRISLPTREVVNTHGLGALKVGSDNPGPVEHLDIGLASHSHPLTERA